MSATWDSAEPPPVPRLTPLGRLLIALRLPAIGVIIFGGLPLLLLARGVERPICGARRPVSSWIARLAMRASLRLTGLRLKVRGRRMGAPGAIVANHSSWLDIFVLNGRENTFFIAKSEVAGWPGIGTAARAAGTLFVKRDPRESQRQQRILEERLRAGHHLCFFPEGTSTDGSRVLPFKSTLFAAFREASLRDRLWIQPVSLVYHAPPGQDARVYGWWGDMDFAPHMIRILGLTRRGTVELIYHDALKVADFPDRKTLARAAGDAVREGVEEARRRPA